MTGAGATWPYGKDPKDSNIRIAPSFPTPEELAAAAEIFVLSVKMCIRDRLEGSLQKIGETLEEKRTERENLQADYEECLEKRNQISEQDQVLEGIRLAHGRIEKLSAEHQNRYGGRLQKRISEIMGELTGVKYRTVVL